MMGNQATSDNHVTTPQFVSFLQQSGFRERINPDHYERKMRRRRLVAYAFIILVVVGFSWVMIESAQALSLF